jgi:uncharacterized membrane protein YdjX (TVP38/TMEM64 family)
VVSRPVPLLAETTVIVAGATGSLSWRRVAGAAAVGSMPAAVLYAIAGAAASRATSVSVVFVLVLALAVVTWLVEHARTRHGRELGQVEGGARLEGTRG